MLADYRKIFNRLNQAVYEFYLQYNKGAQKINEYNLTVQQENILLYIMRNQGVRANDIAANFSITKSAVSQVLSKLGKRKFIVRESNPNNLRESFIFLGEEGKKYAQLIAEADETFIKKYCSQIKVEELEQMVQTMEKLSSLFKENNES
ncbi:MarR family transcriptional regulator [Neobacillus sp. OS1-32]|uniref:MarR family winged helix-turn-helix transcriptional regulator n=1 Tax=Neobacillus sp. OS1-32 TaxID=3070682 RepID=UPI0027E11CCC|nr:MarR family transcriptional regulator [Neobacillus sp. OS1-32]WML29562.1 MarR family transcriptional regulator [Neobacillus sp. OS1-32]